MRYGVKISGGSVKTAADGYLQCDEHGVGITVFLDPGQAEEALDIWEDPGVHEDPILIDVDLETTIEVEAEAPVLAEDERERLRALAARFEGWAVRLRGRAEMRP